MLAAALGLLVLFHETLCAVLNVSEARLVGRELLLELLTLRVDGGHARVVLSQGALALLVRVARALEGAATSRLLGRRRLERRHPLGIRLRQLLNLLVRRGQLGVRRRQLHLRLLRERLVLLRRLLRRLRLLLRARGRRLCLLHTLLAVALEVLDLRCQLLRLSLERLDGARQLGLLGLALRQQRAQLRRRLDKLAHLHARAPRGARSAVDEKNGQQRRGCGEGAVEKGRQRRG